MVGIAVGAAFTAVIAVVGVVFALDVSTGLSLAILGGAVAILLAGVGSSIGVGMAGEAAAGVTAEDPEKYGKLLLLQALPGTQGFYGLIGAFLVMNKLGFFSGSIPDITLDQGWQFFFAMMPVALAGLFSAIFQGRVSVAGIGLTAKRPEESGKALIMAAMVETYAVLGLLASLLLLNGIRL